MISFPYFFCLYFLVFYMPYATFNMLKLPIALFSLLMRPSHQTSKLPALPTARSCLLTGCSTLKRPKRLSL